MKSSLLVLSFILPCLLSCTAPIVKGGTGLTIKAESTVGKDLLASKRNFDNAVKIGVLPADNFAVSCLNDVIKDVGLDATQDTSESFVPENAGAISAGTILYIQSQQLSGFNVDNIATDCKAVVGDLVIKGLALANKVGLRFLKPF